MEPAIFDELFDPFFSTKFTGRGLRLAVVLGLIGAHGGAVAVESEPGKGALFRVLLLLLEPDIQQSSPSVPLFKRGCYSLFIGGGERRIHDR